MRPTHENIRYFSSRPANWFLVVSAFAAYTVFFSPALRADGSESDSVGPELIKAEFLNRNQKLAQEREKILGAPPLDIPPPPVVEPENLISRSAILCFGESLTLVPKRSVIHIPPDFESRMQVSGEPKVISWSTFLALNKGWITTFEVTQQQIAGSEVIPPGAVNKMKKEGNVVIATLEGDPITVLPLTTPQLAPAVSDQTTTDK